ncbi:uncharacterized protein LOC121368307 [Gigantopelta aegis]|uniref:uncharacterized protein LOC121368307 n=1 Tax=Gigantopelta aegis TaxID=1735272 RepID=UPI001B8875B5|nr:uncharacterized protein LOC121368307 [Gigantopelta aegis]
MVLSLHIEFTRYCETDMASSCYTDNDEVSCSLCMEVFSDPRTIPCGHTFCRACLQNLFNSNKKPHSIYRCPVCRKRVSLPDTTKPVSCYADQFPRNVALLQAIDTISKLKQRDAPATTTTTDHLTQNMKSICQKLERFNHILQSKMKSDQIVTTLRAEQTRMKKELQQCQLSTNNGISETRARILNISGIQPDRKRDKMVQTGAFNMQANDFLSSGIQCILVLEGERSNTIVVTDSFNWSVKYFCAETFALQSKRKVFGAPCGLAESRDQQVAVVLPREKQILFLTMRDDTSLTKKVRTDRMYFYIAMLPANRMAVTGGNLQSVAHENWWGKYVDVLDEEGTVIQSLLFDMFIEPWCLAVKGDSLVVVSDCGSLVSVASSGEVTWATRDQQRLLHLRGVTCDVEEFVYVCDNDRSCVVQFSRDGEIIRDILTCQDGLTEPLYVCCDQDKLYVGQSNGEVKIFTWSKD